MQEDERLKIFVGELREHFGEHLKRIILFGSRARGDNVEDSDYDFLLIFDQMTSEIKESIRDLTGEMLYTYNIVLSVFSFTEENLYRRRYSPFIMNAQKEGVVL
jgi:predicted nucleotidyltransferase